MATSKGKALTLLNYLSPQRFKHNQSLELILYIVFFFFLGGGEVGLFTHFMCHKCVFWTKVGQMNLTFKVGGSRLFIYFIKTALRYLHLI